MTETTRSPTIFLTPEHLKTPLLQQLSDMAERFANIRLLIVFPKTDGWGQVRPGEGRPAPSFCRLVQSSKTGAKHCRMCHVLMSIAACSEGTTDQSCHAGALSLVTPIGGDNNDCFAVLSTCIYARSAETEAAMRDIIGVQAEKIGVNPRKLFQSFMELPELTDEQVELGKAIMAATGVAVQEIAERAARECRAVRRGRRASDIGTQSMVEEQLRDYIIVPGPDDGGNPPAQKNGDRPPLIEAVATLVDQRPNMPFRVSEIAAAARITPNHFSAMFHQAMGESFLHYLTERRILLAKQLLGDLTRNVTEVAMATGYDDPGYFSRVFKKHVGMSPRQWRDEQPAAQA